MPESGSIRPVANAVATWPEAVAWLERLQPLQDPPGSGTVWSRREDRVVSGKGSHNVRPASGIEKLGKRAGTARTGTEHNQVLGRLHAGQELGNGPCQFRFRLSHALRPDSEGIPARGLDDSKFAQIPRQRALTGLNAPLRKRGNKVIVGMHRAIGNQGENLPLTTGLGTAQPASPARARTSRANLFFASANASPTLAGEVPPESW